MTGTATKATVRRTTLLATTTLAALLATTLLAGPASAEVPVGWGPQESLDKLYVLGVLVGVPVLLFVLITAAVYLPGVARGERVTPGATGPQDQWLGGRRNAGEITAGAVDAGQPDAVAEATGSTGSAEPVETDGGAGARW